MKPESSFENFARSTLKRTQNKCIEIWIEIYIDIFTRKTHQSA